MTWQSITIPLYEEEDFSSIIPLNGNAYNIRLYYNRRMDMWFMDIGQDGGDTLLTGVALSQFFPILLDYHFPDLLGHFWFQPTARTDVSTTKAVLPGYYELFYMWDEE